MLIGGIVQVSGKSRVRQELTENRIDNIFGYHAILINQQNVGTIASCVIAGGNDLNERTVLKNNLCIGRIYLGLFIVNLIAQFW